MVKVNNLLKHYLTLKNTETLSIRLLIRILVFLMRRHSTKNQFLNADIAENIPKVIQDMYCMNAKPLL